MILVAIGANLPGPDGATPRQNCCRALAALADLPGLRLVSAAPWYRTAPVPPSGQPDYINGMARLTGAADCVALLRDLQAIEDAAGRRRTVANAARTLDLDLIDVNGLVRAAPDPVLPHPRAHLRAFVLVPLIDVAPGWLHPVLRQSAETLLAGLPADSMVTAALPDEETAR